MTGSKLTITAEPADGWEVKSITANGKDITADKTFVVTSNTVVKVVFKKLPPKTYKVTLVKEGEGDANVLVVFPDGDKKELEVGKAISVPAGTKLSVKVYFNSADFYVPSMTANGADILKSRSFVVTEDTTLKVVGARTLSTKVFMDGRGKVSVTVYDARKNNVYTLQDKPERPDDAQYVLSSISYLVSGTKLTITATPADGWEVASITANGKDITTDKSFVVTSNTVVKVVFKKQPPKTYKVTLVCSEGGEATITGADDLNRVPAGTKLTIVTKAGENMELKSLTINGAPAKGFSFVVTEDTVVKVVFKSPQVDVPFRKRK